MRIAFIIITSLHGLIHLFGFIKAFDLSEIKDLTLPVSKSLGLVWGLTFFLFTIVVLLYILKKPYWWVIALFAVSISQILIFLFWQDAKFGTIANLIILLMSIPAYGAWAFEKNYKEDVEESLSYIRKMNTRLLQEEDLTPLPIPVQQYLRYVRVVNKPQVKNVKIIFNGEMRSKEQDWFKFTSEQYNFFHEPERLFFMKANVKGLSTNGYHYYKNTEAGMHIKLLSLFSVANIKGEDLFKAETVTYFNDLCLFAPSNLIDDRINWEAIDSTTAKATFTNQGISISATLYFNQQGQLINFISEDRFDISDMKQRRFSTPVNNYQKIGDFNLCSYGEAIWHYPEGDFVYGKFHVNDVIYNID